MCLFQCLLRVNFTGVQCRMNGQDQSWRHVGALQGFVGGVSFQLLHWYNVRLAKKWASCVLVATDKLLQCYAFEETSTKTWCANKRKTGVQKFPGILTFHGILPGSLYGTKFHLTTQPCNTLKEIADIFSLDRLPVKNVRNAFVNQNSKTQEWFWMKPPPSPGSSVRFPVIFANKFASSAALVALP